MNTSAPTTFCSTCPVAPAAITFGTIIKVNRQDRSFATITNNNPSSAMFFHLADNAYIFDQNGRQTTFQCLMPGMRVRVRHSERMTFSIPPQTTAYEVWIR